MRIIRDMMKTAERALEIEDEMTYHRKMLRELDEEMYQLKKGEDI